MTIDIGKPVDLRPLFRPLNDALLDLLESLTPEDWERQTVARLWTVKDVASHLLDGNIRRISMTRDQFFGEKAPAVNSFEDLVAWLNELNADWIKASRRISPRLLVFLHQVTSEEVNKGYESTELNTEAPFPVSWTGETKSLNWIHIAREYTEKWHHQQQIREATGRDGIMTREFFYPLIDTFFRALPFALRYSQAPEDTIIKVTVTSPIGGDWYLKRIKGSWRFCEPAEAAAPVTTVSIAPDVAWVLFSKSKRPGEVESRIQGDPDLGRAVLEMVSVMA
ncbi:MAG: maleylpyruvate isomerase N-terminal domain-containing protein [Bacteroidetes bacterium]|nr:maleylpyruvate isomerase N-terminal domain-containing protein [Bacteroidota bacterium]